MNRLGFGFLHLPVKEDGEIDLETARMTAGKLRPPIMA